MLKNDKKQDPRKGDDRNLVLVDQDFGQPDLEDRIWLFWIRNKVPILSAATLVILGTLGVIVWFALADYKLESLQAEYQSTADTPEAKLAFARANAGVPLAGIAALDAADRYYSDKKYTEATAAYVLAKDSIAPTDKVLAAFAGRAQLGIAFSKLNAGDRDAAVATLTELARSAVYPDTQRAQALYELAVLAVEKQDFATARQWLDAMDRDVNPENAWSSRKQQLLTYVPALARPIPDATAPTPAPAAPAPEKTTAPAAADTPAPAPATAPTPAP